MFNNRKIKDLEMRVSSIEKEGEDLKKAGLIIAGYLGTEYVLMPAIKATINGVGRLLKKGGDETPAPEKEEKPQEQEVLKEGGDEENE